MFTQLVTSLFSLCNFNNSFNDDVLLFLILNILPHFVISLYFFDYQINFSFEIFYIKISIKMENRTIFKIIGSENAIS